MENSPIYAVILAGGSGMRFWPLSRNETPKHLLRLFDEETLIEKTIKRLEGWVPPEHILILTNHLQREGIEEALPDFPRENIVTEPEKRDTAPAIALAIGAVAARNPDATMMVLPADQMVDDDEHFRETLAGACQAAERSRALVTIGIKPTWACPSYGYIERGGKATLSGYEADIPVYEVKRFREKPSPDLAESFLAQGSFTWNAGIFVWTISAVLNELTRHCPELADFVGEIRRSVDLERTVAGQFSHLPKISIDYALMENASRVLNLEATFGWDDVGSWISIAKYFEADADRNASNRPLAQLSSHDNFVFANSPKQVALLGVKNLIVVDTGDAILVAEKDDAERIKKLVEMVPEALR